MTGKQSKSSKFAIKNPFKNPKFVKCYLFTYNFLQSLGWIYLLYQIIHYYVIRPEGTLYSHIGRTLVIFQNAAILEVFNSIFKLISSSPVIVIPQVYSRVLVVCGVLLPLDDPKISSGLPMLLTAWSITEIIRYVTYTLSLIDVQLYILKWLRYSLFIVMYPLGVTGEVLCMLSAVREVQRTKFWCYEMPNPYNLVFYYDYYIIFTMILYIPVFPKLYLHMFSQRKKVLGATQKKKTN